MVFTSYLLRITDKEMNETRIERGPFGMPKIFSTVTELTKYAKKQLRPQTFGKEDSRFVVEAIEVEITEKATWEVLS